MVIPARRGGAQRARVTTSSFRMAPNPTTRDARSQRGSFRRHDHGSRAVGSANRPRRSGPMDRASSSRRVHSNKRNERITRFAGPFAQTGLHRRSSRVENRDQGSMVAIGDDPLRVLEGGLNRTLGLGTGLARGEAGGTPPLNRPARSSTPPTRSTRRGMRSPSLVWAVPALVL